MSWTTCDAPSPAEPTPRRTSVDDWLVILGFNHLMSGLEAYVSAHLWDFPPDSSCVPCRVEESPAA